MGGRQWSNGRASPPVLVCRGHPWSSKSFCPCVPWAPLVVQILLPLCAVGSAGRPNPPVVVCRGQYWSSNFSCSCVPWAPLVVQITLLSCAAPLDVQIRLFLCAVGTAGRPKSQTSCSFVPWAPLVVQTLLSRCAVGSAGLPTMVPALRANNAFLPKQGFELSVQGVKFQSRNGVF